ncbi:MAG: penicillin-binding protein 2 [Actinomycetota bacterium]
MDSRIKKRIRFAVYILASVVTILVLRLYFLQVMSGDLFAEKAQENIVRTKTIPAPRGNIYDRNGELLVKSIPVFAIAVEPRTALASEETLRFLSRNLDIDYQSLKEKLENTNISYLERIILAQDIDYQTLITFKENMTGLSGVEVMDIYLREYSYGSLAAHVLGYTGEIDEDTLASEKFRGVYEGGDQIGISGIEQSYEDILKGIKGKVTYEVDPLGRPVTTIERIDYISGNDLYLTLDIELQGKVEELLYKAVMENRERPVETGSEETFDVPGGAVVVLEADTGEVLAMANYPTFSPEAFVGGISAADWAYLNDPQNQRPLNNRAVMGYPPGSSFKLVTAYAGLEEVINESSRVSCSGIWYGLGRDFPKLCWRRGGHGSLNVFGALGQSCNSFFYEVGYRLFVKDQNRDELLQKYAVLFGFGRETGIDLPFEEPGLVGDREWKKEAFKDQVEKTVWYPGDTVNMAIGQGDLRITPLQMAQAYMILANRGSYTSPHLVKEVRDYTGELFLEVEGEDREVSDLDEEYMGMVEEGLFQVVIRGTAAGRFMGFPLNEIPVAGKTGTAEHVGRQDFGWFASYAPIGNPKYVVVAMFEEAGGGSASAAPMVREIYEYLFNIDDGHD